MRYLFAQSVMNLVSRIILAFILGQRRQERKWTSYKRRSSQKFKPTTQRYQQPKKV